MKNNYHEMKPKGSLKEILTDDQIEMLLNWISAEGLDPKSVESYDDCAYGVRVFATDPKSGESWEIDFTRRKE